MNTHDIELPAEFRSGNDTPVTQATIKRERMEEILRDAIEADRKRRDEPVAFLYEIASTLMSDGTYSNWSPRLSFSMPNAPDGSIRNLSCLYAAPQPAEPVKVPSDADILFAMRHIEPHLKDVDSAIPTLLSAARSLLTRYGIGE